MKKETNCPNCGAVLKDGRCAYCGTQINNTKDTDEEIKKLELKKQSIMHEMECLRTTTYLTSMLNGNFKPFM